MLSQEDIFTLLEKGVSEEEIAQKIAQSFNSTVKQYVEEQEKKKKREQERKDKAAALALARANLTKAIKDYLAAAGYEIKGDVDAIINKELNALENHTFSGWNLLNLLW